MSEQPWIVVTGASTGIGYAVCQDLLQAGFGVFATVRSAQRAAELQREFDGAAGPLVPVVLDVTDHDSISRGVSDIRQAMGNGYLHGLVNNAGIAVGGPLEHISMQEFRTQLEVNVIGPLAMAQACIPLLTRNASPRRREPGRIVNISSVSGRLAFPFLGPYVASKHALEGLSDCLRRELYIHGIKVAVVAPGNVATPIWDKAGQIPLAPYANTPYASAMAHTLDSAVKAGVKGLPAQAVARTVRHALVSKRPRAKYVPARNKLVSWHIPSWLPKKWFDALAVRITRIKPVTS